MNPNNKNPTNQDKRHDKRTPIRGQVKVSHPSIGSVMVQNRDISDTGIILFTDNIEVPDIGTTFKAQVY